MSVREPGTHVKFVMNPVVHGIKSQEAGHEVTVDEPFVEVKIAGMDKDAFFGPVTKYWQDRFPEEWAAFQAGAEAPKTGMPLNHWARLRNQPSQIRALQNLSIYTVEDLASCSDAGLQRIGMGAHQLREDAKRLLLLSQTEATVERTEALERENADLKAQFAAMQAQMAELLATKPKRGKKVEA
jgi:FtsZ-binding cell division protein ZapB